VRERFHRSARHDVDRVAMVSLHTSPLERPGSGDAGGMNVYIGSLARELSRDGIEVDVFTRATSARQPEQVVRDPGVTVRHVLAGPFDDLPKDELPAQLCSFAGGVLREEAAVRPGHYDLVHSHYWLSGQIGLVAAQRWDVPLVHSMHTMAKVKNRARVDGEAPEPAARVAGEQEVVDRADVLVANTEVEAAQLSELYHADPARVVTIEPGVDLTTFRPVDAADRARLRAARGLPADATVVLFAGRFQPHKAPDLVVRALGRAYADGLLDTGGLGARVEAVFVGGPSGASSFGRQDLLRMASREGIGDRVRVEPPAEPAVLAEWFALADLVVVPSYSESFGLVAAEAQASGTPVLAAAVGGLPTAVRDGYSGLLVHGHREQDWARALAGLVGDPRRLADLREGALEHGRRFSWEHTARRTLAVYRAAVAERRGTGAQAARAG